MVEGRIYSVPMCRDVSNYEYMYIIYVYIYSTSFYYCFIIDILILSCTSYAYNSIRNVLSTNMQHTKVLYSNIILLSPSPSTPSIPHPSPTTIIVCTHTLAHPPSLDPVPTLPLLLFQLPLYDPPPSPSPHGSHTGVHLQSVTVPAHPPKELNIQAIIPAPADPQGRVLPTHP